jgi:hypothetical protein
MLIIPLYLLNGQMVAVLLDNQQRYPLPALCRLPDRSLAGTSSKPNCDGRCAQVQTQRQVTNLYDDKLYRFTMDIDSAVGTHQVMAYEITEITPDTYAEQLAQDTPVVMPSGSGWNAQAMHQIDPVQVDDDSWIASVDGFGEYWIFGWQY